MMKLIFKILKKYFISVHLLILTLILIAFDQLFLLAFLKTYSSSNIDNLNANFFAARIDP